GRRRRARGWRSTAITAPGPAGNAVLRIPSPRQDASDPLETVLSGTAFELLGEGSPRVRDPTRDFQHQAGAMRGQPVEEARPLLAPGGAPPPPPQESRPNRGGAPGGPPAKPRRARRWRPDGPGPTSGRLAPAVSGDAAHIQFGFRLSERYLVVA